MLDHEVLRESFKQISIIFAGGLGGLALLTGIIMTVSAVPLLGIPIVIIGMFIAMLAIEYNTRLTDKKRGNRHVP